MDYSSDACMNSFTEGQNIRMAAMWDCFREKTPGVCDSSLIQTQLTNDFVDGDFFICFSSSSTAIVKGKGETTMDSIDVGDQVLTAMGDYEIIYSIDHRSKTKLTHFIQIDYSLLPLTTATITEDGDNSSTTKNGHNNKRQQQQQHKNMKPLEITSKHMLFLVGKENPIPANTVQIGDQIQTLGGPGTVTDISTITKKGFYNFLTKSGSIVVNGILASTYSAKFSNHEYIDVTLSGGGEYNMKQISHQDFFNRILVPYRYICTATISLELCNSLTTKNDDDDERAPMSKLVFNVHKLILKQKKVYQIVCLGFIVLAVQVLSVISFYLYNTISMLGMVLLVSVVVQSNKKRFYLKK